MTHIHWTCEAVIFSFVYTHNSISSLTKYPAMNPPAPATNIFIFNVYYYKL